MISISAAIFYVLMFLSVYVQVFFLITFFENRKKIITRNGNTQLAKYRGVTIIVPSFNEEKTIEKTVESLLSLNYPKDKLNIFLIDDGSTDDTWKVISKFTKYSNIKVFHKKNGGKYTALNFGLANTTTDFVGCLDADSYVHTESLARLMSYFEKKPDIMAVVPSVVVHNPSGAIQKAQKAEYHLGVFFKKMQSFMGAIHVTPGPFTIFRKKVFDDLGPYRHAHNTEDMEIAYRMQKNFYKIDHCNDAYVYTSTPRTIGNLFRQRLRWIYGFINNTFDYKDVLFNKKYGNFSTFTLPAGIISVFSVSYILGRTIYSVGHFLYFKILQFQTVGFHLSDKAFHFDFFFLNVGTSIFAVVFIYFSLIFSIAFGRKLAEGKWSFPFDVIYYSLIFSLIAPLWIMKAVYNTVVSRRAPNWR